MYYGKWEEAINTLKRHLELKNATWNLERAASMRFIARCYINLNNEKEAEFWYKLAIREAYTELGILLNKQNKYLDSIYYLLKALEIKNKDMIYINEVFCWDGTIEDIMSLNYYYLSLYEESLFYIDKALKYNSNNERLRKNKELIQNKLKNNI